MSEVVARRPMHLLVADLNEALGSTLVAFMANVRSRQLPARWASGEVVPRDGAKVRLLLAYRAFEAIAAAESVSVARAWMIGANPWLGGNSPASRIREHSASDVFTAVDAFLADTGGA